VKPEMRRVVQNAASSPHISGIFFFFVSIRVLR
ncbi:MAG: hypothetical protein ACI90V_011625, partial [Bacillariaceae sp.]